MPRNVWMEKFAIGEEGCREENMRLLERDWRFSTSNPAAGVATLPYLFTDHLGFSLHCVELVARHSRFTGKLWDIMQTMGGED